ncbi:MAG: WD40 repeat domain-containing protein [bacterium]|nr:WD40 repeat domain-containing protein [bacterium]
MPKFRLILLSLVVLCLPIITSAQTPIFSAENPIITPENASQITQLAMIGRGAPSRIAYSPDASRIAVSTTIGVWLYDTANLDAEPRLLADATQYGWISDVEFSPDSRFIVAGIGAEFAEASDGMVRLWDVQTGELINRFQHDATVWHVAYSPDGQFIATGARTGIVQIWHIQTGKVAQTLLGDEEVYITSLTYSPDGRSILASYVSDNDAYDKIIVWNIFTGEPFFEINHETNHAIYSPDGQFIATSGADLVIWDAQTGDQLHNFPINADMYDLVYSPDGQFIVAPISTDENIAIYDAQTGEVIDLMRGHEALVFDITYSPDGRYLVSRSFSDTTIKVWDMTDKRVIHTLTGFNQFINAATFSPDGSHIATSQDHRIWMWDIQSLTSYQPLNSGDLFVEVDRMLYNESLTPLLYSPDGQFFVSQQSDDTITVWDVETGAEVQSLVNEHRSDRGLDVHSLAFRPNTTILTAIDEGVVKFWDVETGDLLHQITDKQVRRFSYSPDGTMLALSSVEWDSDTNTYDISVEVLNADTYIVQDDMKIDDLAYGLTLSVTPQGNFFLYGVDREKGVAVLWDVETESIFLELTVDADDISYSPDGSLILGTSRNRLVLWHAETGEFIRLLEGHVENAGATFSPDGRYIVSHSSDGTIRLWGVPAGG